MASRAVHRYRRVCEALTMGDNAFNEALTAKRAREYTHQNALALTPRQEAIRSAVGNAFASMIPGVGDVMDAREGYDTLREAGGDFERGDYLSGIGNTLSGAAIGASALIPFLGFGGIKRAAENVGEAVSDGRKGIRAYHGSPHDFDRFSMDKIGTGEGAQAYGHGLYFAQQEDTAQQYRDALKYPRVKNPSNAVEQVADDLNYHRGDAAGLKRIYEGMLERGSPDAQKMAREKLDALPEALGKYKGHMYEVNIDADEADFLDWDAPFGKQPQRAQDAMKKAWEDAGGTLEGRTLPPFASRDDAGIESMLAAMEMSMGRGKQGAAETYLREAGIPGIKYKDAGSRGVDGVEASRNFVVFDDKLISILRKYGVAGLLAAGLTAQQADQFVAQYEGQPGGGV
jgi:hypothetical protein